MRSSLKKSRADGLGFIGVKDLYRIRCLITWTWFCFKETTTTKHTTKMKKKYYKFKMEAHSLQWDLTRSWCAEVAHH